MLQDYIYRSFAPRFLAFLCALGVLGGYCLSASGLTPATLLTRDLERREVNLTGLSGGTVSYFGEDRTLTREPVGTFVRLTLDAEASSPDVDSPPEQTAATGLVELVDGQRLTGRYAGPRRGGEALAWEHPVLGTVEVALDDLRRLVPDRAAASPAVPEPGDTPADLVRLTNGDTLGGFVVAIDDASVTLAPDAGGEVTLPLDRVASLSLSNPAAMPADAADLVVLRDGSRLRVMELLITGDALRFDPVLAGGGGDGDTVELPLGDVERVDFAASGVRLVDLTDRPMEVISGGEALGLTLPPRVERDGLHLHAPVTVRFELPPGARRMAMTATLDLPEGLPPERAAWADVAVRVEPPGGAGDDVRLDAAERHGDLSVALPPDAASVDINVDPGRHGPVLDRVRLHDAVLLVETAHPPERAAP